MNRTNPHSGTGTVTALAVLLLASALAIGAAAVVKAAVTAHLRLESRPDPVAQTMRIAARMTRALAADPTPEATSRFDPVFRAAETLEGVTVEDGGAVAGASEASTPYGTAQGQDAAYPLNVNLAPEGALRAVAAVAGMTEDGRRTVLLAVDAFIDERTHREIRPAELSAAWGALAERGVISARAAGVLGERYGTTSVSVEVTIVRSYAATVVLFNAHGSIAPVRIAIRTRSAMDSAESLSMMEAR